MNTYLTRNEVVKLLVKEKPEITTDPIFITKANNFIKTTENNNQKRQQKSKLNHERS